GAMLVAIGDASVSSNCLSETDTDLVKRLQELSQGAQAGDAQALAGLRRLLDEHPNCWQRHSDLGKAVEEAWLAMLHKVNPLDHEVLKRQLAALKVELAGTDASPLERLLVQRIAVCWLQVSYADLMYLELGKQKASLAVFAAAEKRQNRAQHSLLQESNTMAAVRE